MPIIRLPTTIFPGHPISLMVAEDIGDQEHRMARRPRGCITPELASTITADFGGRVALVADGLAVGVVANIGSAVPTGSGFVHVVGGERVRLLETLERMACGGRLAAFELIDDEQISLEDERALAAEADRAAALLAESSRAQRAKGAGGSSEWELLLCHLDDEVSGDDVEDAMVLPNPTTHPQWLASSSVPDDPSQLSFWLACRLPLTTALRAHLLGLDCPLKRLRDVVDALRLLSNPSRIEGDGRFAKLAVVWHTAEASGCEVDKPRPIIHWRGGDVVGVSRY